MKSYEELMQDLAVPPRPTCDAATVGAAAVMTTSPSFSVPLESPAVPLPIATVPAALREMPVLAATANTTGGGLTLPLLAAGYLIINVAGTQFKVPYYAN